MREDTVRLWRSDFSRGGIELKASVAPGPSPVKSETALRVVTPLLEEPVADRPNWTIARLRAEIEAREGVASAARNCPRRCEKKFRYRRPRHTLKGRQVASEVDRIGLRLQLREQQAAAGDIVLLYGDESEALTHPYLARAWAKSGADLRVPAPGQAKKVAMLGSLNHVTRELIVHTSPTKRSSDFVAHLEQIDALYGPMPGRAGKPVVLVEDNGPIHVSKLSRAALAARAHWLTVEWLPKYAPELNDIEVVWHDLKAYQLAHKTFTDVAELDGATIGICDRLRGVKNKSGTNWIFVAGMRHKAKGSNPDVAIDDFFFRKPAHSDRLLVRHSLDKPAGAASRDAGLAQ